MVAQDVYAVAADADPSVDDVDVAALSRFIVAAADGLILQYEVHHDRALAARDSDLTVRAAMLLVRDGLPPTRRRGDADDPRRSPPADSGGRRR